MKIALAQVNPTVGDVDGNAAMAVEWIERAKGAGADLVAFPELMICGYPPEDLLLRRSFIAANVAAVETAAQAARGITAIIGFADPGDGSGVANAAAICVDGRVAAVAGKQLLPNYGVFDEHRYFTPATQGWVSDGIGVCVCEDIWEPGPVADLAARGAALVVNINGSPFHLGKHDGIRQGIVSRRARDNNVWIAYVNMVGGQDELVFDGGSFVVDPTGTIRASIGQFCEDLLVYELGGKGTIAPDLSDEEEVYTALVTGVRDYVRKCGFKHVILGMSGGIDSSLVATIATDALGPGNVTGVINSSRYSSAHSRSDAFDLATRLGIRVLDMSIEKPHAAFEDMLSESLRGEPHEFLAWQNVQARIRGLAWMALSNARNKTMVLTCGNKSEMATGYATLYGDMAGGFAVLKDVPKTLVYRLANWRNHDGVIPQGPLTKPPSAELAPGQLDSDSLPPYDILDPILEAYVERDFSAAEIVAMGFDRAIVARVIGLVDHNEYKRRQAAPGVKVTPRAFGRDRRLPIANRWSERF